MNTHPMIQLFRTSLMSLIVCLINVEDLLSTWLTIAISSITVVYIAVKVKNICLDNQMKKQQIHEKEKTDSTT